MEYELPTDANDAINELTDDELDFIERELFYAFDAAYEDYHQNGVVDNQSAIVMYERGLETIRAVRTIRDAMDKEEFESAKNIHDSLT
jgi:hypothetical protein